MPRISHSICSDHITDDTTASWLEALTKHEQRAWYDSAYSMHSLVFNTDKASNDRKNLEAPSFSTKHYHAWQLNLTEVTLTYLRRILFVVVSPLYTICLQWRNVRIPDVLTEKPRNDNENQFTESWDWLCYSNVQDRVTVRLLKGHVEKRSVQYVAENVRQDVKIGNSIAVQLLVLYIIHRYKQYRW